MKDYPAIVVRTDAPDLVLALVDDFGPSAVEELDGGETVRIFFSTAAERDVAAGALAPRFEVTRVDVSDEDWARRSQENLRPVTVGRITLFPNTDLQSQGSASREAGAISLVIQPSMGFGTGHHATTRLCLAALQDMDLDGKTLVDVGTGSGVLAMAAQRLGAARALGIDYDPDAILSASENLELNPSVRHVRFDTVDLSAATLPSADIVTANLTGALLVRSAAALLAIVPSGGVLILSGLLAHERDAVCGAFAPAAVVRERDEDGWVGLTMKKP